MDTKMPNTTSMANTISESLQSLANMSVAALKSNIESTSGNITQLSRLVKNVGIGPIKLPFLNKEDCDCCPPKSSCPPHCLTAISRTAYAGERILVPFIVKNTCSHGRVYRLGVRELKSIDGSLAPNQPVLNKATLNLQPGQGELVLMGIDLANFAAGSSYNAEIVIREKEINQNICFSLSVEAYNNVPVAEPVDEKKYSLRWQSWQSHFYCETPRKSRQG